MYNFPALTKKKTVGFSHRTACYTMPVVQKYYGVYNIIQTADHGCNNNLDIIYRYTET